MTSRPLVVHVVGARPNYMKIAPIYAELERQRRRRPAPHSHGPALRRRALATSSSTSCRSPSRTYARGGLGLARRADRRALEALERCFIELKPDLVVVPGDVNSTLAGALAAVKLQIPVCHVESGLRSFDWSMPEEHNRRLTDHVSSLLLTHCDDGEREPRRRGHRRTTRDRFVGNTMIDTLLANLRGALEAPRGRARRRAAASYLLVTLHRPALVDDPDAARPHRRALERSRRRCRSSSRCIRGRAAGWTSSASSHRQRLLLVDPLALPPVPVARRPARRGRHRLGRRAGGDHGARDPVLHAARQHGAAGDDHARNERPARPRSRAASPRFPTGSAAPRSSTSRRSGTARRGCALPRRSSTPSTVSRRSSTGSRSPPRRSFSARYGRSSAPASGARPLGRFWPSMSRTGSSSGRLG